MGETIAEQLTLTVLSTFNGKSRKVFIQPEAFLYLLELPIVHHIDRLRRALQLRLLRQKMNKFLNSRHDTNSLTTTTTARRKTSRSEMKERISSSLQDSHD